MEPFGLIGRSANIVISQKEREEDHFGGYSVEKGAK